MLHVLIGISGAPDEDAGADDEEEEDEAAAAAAVEEDLAATLDLLRRNFLGSDWEERAGKVAARVNGGVADGEVGGDGGEFIPNPACCMYACRCFGVIDFMRPSRLFGGTAGGAVTFGRVAVVVVMGGGG